jgi:hypothetical protein
MLLDFRIGARGDHQCSVECGDDMSGISSPWHAAQLACEVRTVQIAGGIGANSGHAIRKIQFRFLCEVHRENAFRQRSGRGVIATGLHHDQRVFPVTAEAAAFFCGENIRKTSIRDGCPSSVW